MLNLFQSEVVEDVPGYDIHIDLVADKEYEEFLNKIGYIEDRAPDFITNLYPGPKGLCISLRKD